MNKVIIFVCLIFLACSQYMKCGKNSRMVVAEEKLAQGIDTILVISNIKKEFGAINSNRGEYEKVQKDLLGHSSEGGIVEAFFDHKDLKIIRSTYYGESGNAITEYYFDVRGVFFVFKVDYYYEMPTDPKGIKINRKEESRYYFFNNELIRWIGIGNQLVDPNSLKFKEEGNLLMQDVDKLKKIITE